MRFFIFVLLLLPKVSVAQSLLWEVSGNGLKQPSYLFGTYHILKDSYLDKTPTVQTAFNLAQGIVVETTVDSAAMLSMAMRAIMPDNSLKKLLSETDYQLVSDEFKKTTGYDLTMFNQMKPIMTATTLSLSYAEKEVDTLSKFSGLPLDLYFAMEAKKRKKVLTPLETMEQQMAFLFDHDPVEKQAADLVRMVKEKKTMQGQSKRLTDLYLAGDLNGMWKLSQEYEEKYGDLSYLVNERNQTWMGKLPTLMALRPTFVAVGALHLPGPSGLITLLRNAGFQVKPL
ncbi:TraB/GumN family protein [Spirosoma endbachense]|uniref:TraB/GumN family protein n=1 Tax=Spirosoma endbachense TaxID=2666025 RepID=A0A6P1W4W3_9BACT|nr:TraB/GumN family protein [Spirosoma endbachense]QHV99049.1 TraB/GumN family protein [Spirosoma endbachense]